MGSSGVVGGQQAEAMRRLLLALSDLHPPMLSALPADGCLPHLLQQPRPGVRLAAAPRVECNRWTTKEVHRCDRSAGQGQRPAIGLMPPPPPPRPPLPDVHKCIARAEHGALVTLMEHITSEPVHRIDASKPLHKQALQLTGIRGGETNGKRRKVGGRREGYVE